MMQQQPIKCESLLKETFTFFILVFTFLFIIFLLSGFSVPAYFSLQSLAQTYQQFYNQRICMPNKPDFFSPTIHVDTDRNKNIFFSKRALRMRLISTLQIKISSFQNGSSDFLIFTIVVNHSLRYRYRNKNIFFSKRALTMHLISSFQIKIFSLWIGISDFLLFTMLLHFLLKKILYLILLTRRPGSEIRIPLEKITSYLKKKTICFV